MTMVAPIYSMRNPAGFGKTDIRTNMRQDPFLYWSQRLQLLGKAYVPFFYGEPNMIMWKV